MKPVHSLLRLIPSSFIQLTPRASFSSTAHLSGRKTRNPYDVRETMRLLGSDVGPHKPGGTKQLQRQIGLRGDMPQLPGVYDKAGKFHFVHEMVPEFVVPDLTDFKLKPYVSYRVPDVKQTEFTAKDLFDATYGKSVVEKYKQNKLNLSDVELEDLVKKT